MLDAALDLFIESGFANTRVEDIAARAGLSKGAVYLYFSSKEAVLEGIVRRAIVPIAATAVHLVESYAGDPRTIITQLLGGLGNQMFQYAIGRRLAHDHAASWRNRLPRRHRPRPARQRPTPRAGCDAVVVVAIP